MRIKELREAYNIQQKELAFTLNIPPSTFSQYENGRREPSYEIVSKIADYFHVTTDYIYGRSEIITCDGCGISYCPSNELDRETHRVIHKKWIKTKEKYGFCYSNHAENERIKSYNRNIVKNLSLPFSTRYDSQMDVFRCLFSRSLEASNYSERHVDFESYIAMLLNQESTKENLDDELYNKLISEFGTKQGISNGQTYYYNYEPQTIAAHFDGDEYTDDELEKIKEFAEFVKSSRK